MKSTSSIIGISLLSVILSPLCSAQSLMQSSTKLTSASKDIGEIHKASIQLQGGDFGVGNGGDGLDLSYPGAFFTSAPVELPNGKVNFSNLKKTWDNGQKLNAKTLKGKWKLVALASNESCDFAGKNQYDANGIKNDDGSNRRELLFENMVSGSDDFSGIPGKSVLTVSLSGIGGKDYEQGPYEVDPLEPQFAQWPYQGNSFNKQGYFEFFCRGVSETANKMICAIQLVIIDKKSPLEISNNYLACANSGIGVILGYVKEDTNK